MNFSDLLGRFKTGVGGSPNDFPLTVRIFHSVMAICVAALVYNVPFNLSVGLPFIALISGITAILVALMYYFSRYRGYTNVARVAFCIAGTALFVTNYFLNSGIDGPTGYFFVLMMVVMVAIVPVNEYWYWVGSNVLLLFSLHAIQYFSPELVPYTYTHKADRYLDISSAYLTVIVLVLACFYIIRSRYDAERKEAQQNAERLRQLDAEKNKIFSVISHDLRSPLIHIQNYLVMLADYQLSDEERREIKAELLRSTRNTAEMVDNVLHWSKSQLSGAVVVKKELNVAELLHQQMQLFNSIAARKQIAVESILTPEATIWGNTEMVQLIVRNLVNNAIKFTLPGGRVRVSADKSGNSCLIVVKDTGSGKPAQLANSIFQFSSTTTAGTANEVGSGLGLALCHEYTTAMGGRIWFTCDAESGTTFFVELPANPTAV